MFDSYVVEPVKIMGENFTPRSITEADYLEFSESLGIYLIKNKKLFTRFYSSGFVLGQYVVDTDTGNVKNLFSFWRPIDSGSLSSLSTRQYLLNAFLFEDSENKKLFYFKIDLDALAEGETVFLYPDIYFDNYNPSRVVKVRLEPLLEQPPLLEGFDERGLNGLEDSRWKKTSVTGQDTYRLSWKEVNGEKTPFIVKESEYVAEPPKVVTLKPINR